MPSFDPRRLAARRRELLQADHVRRRAGWVMVASAGVGLVTAIGGTAVAWHLTGAVNEATTESLAVTIDALDTLEDTLAVADDVVTDTADSLDAVETNLDALDTSVATGSDVVGDASDLTGAASPALADIAATLRRLEDLGLQIDGLLTTVSNLPLAPDYDAANGLGPTFGDLADDIEPLPAAFGATSASLARFETSLVTLQTELGGLVESVGEVNRGLDDSRELIDDYRASVADARALAVDTSDGLERDETMLRILIVIGGLNFAVIQLVPLWVGWELLDGQDEPDRDPGRAVSR